MSEVRVGWHETLGRGAMAAPAVTSNWHHFVPVKIIKVTSSLHTVFPLEQTKQFANLLYTVHRPSSPIREPSPSNQIYRLRATLCRPSILGPFERPLHSTYNKQQCLVETVPSPKSTMLATVKTSLSSLSPQKTLRSGRRTQVSHWHRSSTLSRS